MSGLVWSLTLLWREARPGIHSLRNVDSFFLSCFLCLGMLLPVVFPDVSRFVTMAPLEYYEISSAMDATYVTSVWSNLADVYLCQLFSAIIFIPWGILSC